MRVAIVTGASSGLGRAISLAYAKNGWKVVCSDIRDGAPKGETVSTVDAIRQSGSGQGHFVRANVSQSEDVQNLVSTAVYVYGRLDVMVNNAGISLESYNLLGPKPIQETGDSTFDSTIAVNLRSVFLGSKYALRQFLQQQPHASGHRGWIINMASVYGLKPEVNHGMPFNLNEFNPDGAMLCLTRNAPVSYSTSKAGVVHMTKCLAREHGPSKIHCNAICPGCKLYLSLSLSFLMRRL